MLAHLLFLMICRSNNPRGNERALPNRQLLVGYWGQNSAGPKFGKWNYERDLRQFCNNFKFDIYVIAFVHRLFDPRHPGKTLSFCCT
jgi:hypothetical protein